MWSHRRARRVKAWVMLAVSVALASVVSVYVLRVYQRTWPDEGVRPLVIIATEGQIPLHTVVVASEVRDAGAYTFRVALESRASSNIRSAVPFTMTIVGLGAEGVGACASPGVEEREVTLEQLDAGTRYAFEVDQRSALLSATAVGTPKGQPRFLRVTGELETMVSGESVESVRPGVGADGARVALECTLGAPSVWASAESSTPMADVRSTLLAPQFNAVTDQLGDDDVSGLRVDLWVERDASARIEQAYPGPEVDSEGWRLAHSIQRYPNGADRLGFYYSNQPTWLFENRDKARAEQALLLFGGILLGLALSLFQSGVSDLIDAHARTEPEIPAGA